MSLNVNKEVIKTWKEYYKNHQGELSNEMKLVPMFYDKSEYIPEKNKERILSVGFNPSYVEKNYKQVDHLKKITFKHKWKNFKDDDLEDVLKIDIALRKMINNYEHLYYKPYFKPLEDFYSRIKFFWGKKIQKSHFDLFFLRGTDQKEAQKLLIKNQRKKKNSEGRKETELTSFGKDNLILFEKMLKSFDPSIIFIFNAGSSHIFNEKFLKFQKISDDGFYYLKGSNRMIPVVLSTMLTNGRMDIFSRELLLWQINKYFK
tara:strand:- start:289 stop:1068 length:780 start_codon:yes stop_codon:yes gene_type:complete